MRVELSGVHVNRDKKPILRDFGLTTEENEYLVILGGNGVGKTTTLRTIAGLQSLHAGDVLLGGESVAHLPPRKRSVSMVFQDNALFPHLTVGQNIQQSQKRERTRKERDAEFNEITNRLRLDSLIHRYPDQLSGGEARRTAIAKAMAKRAEIRLLDEPLSALDPVLRPQLLHDLHQWHSTSGGTTIHVTHDGEEAMQIADRIAILSDGQIVQIDTPTKIYDQPVNLDAATALGCPAMNLIRCKDPSDQIGVHVDVPSTWPSMKSIRSECVVLGVRPEDLRITHSGRDPLTPKQCLSLKVEVSRCWRSYTRLRLSTIWNNQLIEISLDPNDQHSSDLIGDLVPGNRLEAYVSLDRIHTFEADSGLRID